METTNKMDLFMELFLFCVVVWLLVSVCGHWKAGLQLQHIPGPMTFPVLGNTFQICFNSVSVTLQQWRKIYGPVYKISQMGNTYVVISGHKAIKEILVTRSAESSGTPRNLRTDMALGKTAITFSSPDKHWKTSRHILHGQIRQFGAGMHRMEETIYKILNEEMLCTFRKAARKTMSIDPRNTIRKTAMRSVANMIFEKQLDANDSFFHWLDEFEVKLNVCVSKWDNMLCLVDLFPLLRHLPLARLSCLESVAKLRSMVVDAVMRFISTNDGFSKVDVKTFMKDSDEAASSSLAMLTGGVTTSSISMITLLNVLAHHKHIQDKAHAEIIDNISDNTPNVKLQHLDCLPYIRAINLELLRYFSAIPLPGHVLLKCVKIQDLYLPAGTHMLINLWDLHHDEDFWGDPYTFRPERFMDVDGNLLPPDDVKRRRLLPFGAGSRACPGEKFATTRLFLWSANIIREFEILPGNGNTRLSADPRNFEDQFVLIPPRYEVYFKLRY